MVLLFFWRYIDVARNLIERCEVVSCAKLFDGEKLASYSAKPIGLVATLDCVLARSDIDDVAAVNIWSKPELFALRLEASANAKQNVAKLVTHAISPEEI